jgi:hypothetical protein
VIYIAPVLGLLAGVVSIADTIPYVRDTVRGTTRPHRGTWLIWGVLAIVVCLSQRADGASWSLIMAAAQAVLTSAVFLLSIRRGEGGLSPADVQLQLVGRTHDRESARHLRHAARLNRSTGPERSFVSRTMIMRAASPTSTQLPPPLPV